MDKSILIILIISIPLIIFYLLNTLTLRQIFKRSLRKDDNLNDAKYWELKYKQEFFAGMFLVVISTASFLGYNLIQDIKDSTKQDIVNEMQGMEDSIKIYKTEIASLNKSTKDELDTVKIVATAYQGIITNLVSRQQRIILDYNHYTDSLSVLTAQLNNTKDRIKEINSKPILEKDIYIVDAGIYNSDSLFHEEPQTLYFDKLRTIRGDLLPLFSKPPLIEAISNQGAHFNIFNTTNTSFQFMLESTNGYQNNSQKMSYKLNLLITEDK